MTLSSVANFRNTVNVSLSPYKFKKKVAAIIVKNSYLQHWQFIDFNLSNRIISETVEGIALLPRFFADYPRENLAFIILSAR